MPSCVEMVWRKAICSLGGLGHALLLERDVCTALALWRGLSGCGLRHAHHPHVYNAHLRIHTFTHTHGLTHAHIYLHALIHMASSMRTCPQVSRPCRERCNWHGPQSQHTARHLHHPVQV